jgi:hypothetical protein
MIKNKNLETDKKMANITVVTGRDVTQGSGKYLTVISPALSLTTGGLSVVKDISATYKYTTNGEYIQLVYSFQLVAALLDSAPTNSKTGSPVIFQLQISTVLKDDVDYVVEAQIQTLGSSTKAPTYVTPSQDKLIYFPVTNFFSVTAPGSPYTITITLTKSIAT